MLDYNKLKQLRTETGVSFSLCKKALQETENDIAVAKKKLNEWGVKKASEKSKRETGDGAIFAYVHHNKRVASLLELKSETDFVSGNDEFQKLGQELAMQVASITSKPVEELWEEEYIRDPEKKINELKKGAILKFGENIRIAS